MSIDAKQLSMIGLALGLGIAIGACGDTGSPQPAEREAAALSGQQDTSAPDQAPTCARRGGRAGGHGDCGCDQAGEPGCRCGGHHGRSFVDEDGDGNCDHHDGQASCRCGGRHGRSFVDEDGDGNCDHHDGQASCRCRKHHGRSFVDEDGDGNCDHHDEQEPDTP